MTLDARILAANALPAGASCLRRYSGRKSAALRHADGSAKGPLAGKVRKLPAHGQNDAIDPDVWSGRALQEDFVELAVAVLHQCIRPLIGACGAPGHHGYQRACVLVNGQASTGHLGHQCSHALGKPNLHLVSSSRRPRLETVDWVTSSLAPHIAQFLCSSQGPFLRPGPQNVDRVARRGGQGRPSRLACGWLRRCRAAP